MQRLQFWRKQTKPGAPGRNRAAETAKNGKSEIKNIVSDAKDGNCAENQDAAKSPLYDPDYASVEGAEDSDGEPNLERHDSWHRNSNLSFETFKGPQSSSGSEPESTSASQSPDSSKSTSDESARGIPTTISHNSSPEAIYSIVNKPKPSKSDPDSIASESGKPDPVNLDVKLSEVDPSANGEHIKASSYEADLSMSFDDVLNSFQLSVTDLVGIEEKTETKVSNNQDQSSGTETEMNYRHEPDLVPIHALRNVTTTPEEYPVDVDLMMSDEVIYRARKSVTFNEVIQERPLSTGENEIVANGVMNALPVANGVNKKQENSATKIVAMPTKFPTESAERAKLCTAGNSANGGAAVVTVMSTDIYSGDEEKLLERGAPSVSKLAKTRTVLLLLTWLCLGVMIDLTTCNFPVTQLTVDVTTEELARAYIVSGAGSMLAAIFIALVCTYTSRDFLLWVVFGLFTIAIGLVAFPWCSRLEMIYSAYGIMGFGQILVVSATVLQVFSLWEDRKLDVAIHFLFALQALGSAAVPQISHHLGVVIGNLTIPGFSDDVTNGDLDGAIIRRPDFNSTDSRNVGEILKDIFQLRVPMMVPLYCLVGALGVVCSVLICFVLSYKNIQIMRRKEYQRKIRRLRRQNLKRQIRLVETAQTKPIENGGQTEIERKSPIEGNTEMDLLLSKIKEIRQNGEKDSHVDVQMTKLLAYARSLQVDPKSRLMHNEDGFTDKSARCVLRDEKWLQGYQTFGVGTQMYLYVFFAIAGGLTLAYSQFLYLYAHTHMKMTLGYEDKLVMSLFWGSAAIARISVIPVSKILSPNALMLTCLVTNMSSSAVMIAYAERYPVLLWLFSGLLGASVGPMLPGGFTWGNVYYNIRAPKVVGLLFGFWALGAMLFPWICGFVVENWGLPAMYYMTITTAGLASVLYLPILITLSRRRLVNLKTNGKKVVSLPARTYL